MVEILSENEKYALMFIKSIYDAQRTNLLTFVEPKIDFKITENTMVSLQEKGYIEVNKANLNSCLETTSILLKDKFLAYFNI